MATGVLWISLLFATLLGVGRTMGREQADRGIEGLLLSPIAKSAVFLGKAMASLALMAVVSIAIVGSVRDPIILRQLDSWLAGMQKAIRDRLIAVFGADIEQKYELQIRVFGRDATMGPLESDRSVGHEVGLLFQTTADSQDLATQIMKSVSHMAVHYPVPEWTGLITSIAFPYSPAEITRGASYRFNLNHVVEPGSPLEMFPIEYETL